jgi:lysosomal Pro-X carboxypeptidase
LIDSSIPSATQDWFTQTIDHFNFQNTGTFQQRYLYTSEYFKPNGPIFFYCGNEGDVYDFYNNTGYQFVLAKEHGAMVVFAEHRYYGKSMPFGAASFTQANVGFLSSEQALADYARLLPALKAKWSMPASTPVIAFGGSYGGMLAAWFRMKYPNIVTGSLAASAPILYFQGLTRPGVFNEIVTNDFEEQGCSEQLKQGMLEVIELGKTAAGLARLSGEFKVCKPGMQAGEAATLMNIITAAITYAAMVDYPFPANFLQPLPAWPVKRMCAAAKAGTNSTDNVAALSRAIMVYYNSSGQLPCLTTAGAGTPPAPLLDDAQGWNYQACTEMVMPMSADGVNDMFPPSPWNLTSYAQGCETQQPGQLWTATPRPTWVETYYGGRAILPASNIIFSNGRLDPWSGGGVNASLSKSIIAILIEDGAHHVDLRTPDVNDPPSITAARAREADIIRGWLDDAYGRPTYNKREGAIVTIILFGAAFFIIGSMYLYSRRPSQKGSSGANQPLLIQGE